MSLIPEGWNEHALGFAKWFGDHWKFAPDALEAQRIEAEASLRAICATQQLEAEAAALRAQADVTDPAVDTAPTLGSNPSPEPESTVATATVVPTDAEAGTEAAPEETPADTAEPTAETPPTTNEGAA